eukprot:g19425.t1
MPCVAIGARDEEEEQEVSPPPPPPPAMRKVLFVDVDHVLNSTPDPRAIRLEEEPCALLQQLLKRTGAHLVLTSHWRRHQAYLLEILANYGS